MGLNRAAPGEETSAHRQGAAAPVVVATTVVEQNEGSSRELDRHPRATVLSPFKVIQAITGNGEGRTSLSGSDEWVMEGYSPQRDRATAETILPPLAVAQEYPIDAAVEFNSPVAVTGHLILAEDHYRLHAFAREEGQRLWSANLPGVFVSPAVAGDRILVRVDSGDTRSVVALSADSGQRLWTYEFPATDRQYNDFGGSVTPPLVVAGRVLVGADHFFQALDVETGRELWAFQTDEPISSAAAVAGNTLYFTDFIAFHALDLQTGVERWRFAPQSGTNAIYFAPVVSDDLVITTSGNTAYALDRHTGQVMWQRTMTSAHLIPAGAMDEQVYLKGSNRLYALDRTTGADIWSFGVTNLVTLPAIAGEQVYLITRTGGQTQLRALNRSDGQEIWQIVNARLSIAAPVAAGGRVYVRTVDGRVLVYTPTVAENDRVSLFLKNLR